MDHLKFTKINIQDTERRRRMFPGYKLAGKSNVEHGNYIKEAVENSIKQTLDNSQKFNFNPYLIMKIELEEGVTFSEEEEEKLNIFGLKIIDKESNQIQVVFSENTYLVSFKQQLERYHNGEIAKKRIANEDLFLKIKKISEWGRDDRLNFNEAKAREGNYLDVYLWVFDSIQLSQQKMNEFKKYVSDNGGRICDTYVGNSVVLARIKIVSDIVEKILNNPLVYKVQDIEKITVIHNEISEISKTSIDDLEFDNTKLNPDTSTSICIIDSGIFRQHPLFNGVIGYSKTFYLNQNVDDLADDVSGHGTKVASVCEYGDFSYNQSFVPTIYLHNAKIHNGEYDDPDTLWRIEVEKQIGNFVGSTIDNYLLYGDGEITIEEFINTFDSDLRPYLKMVYSKYHHMYEKLIPTQMREIVEYFYNHYGCRIYNLSQGDLNDIYIGGKPKAWACVLDELQNEYDILFVVSSGNYCFEKYNDFSNIDKEYPKYFFNSDQCKIIEPANSVNSITVGSIAISDNIYNANIQRVNRQSITKQNQLSSTSRVGPGVRKSIKPDFVAYGGDRGIEEDILKRKMPLKNDKGLSKLLFNNDNNGIFAWDNGTSFAAPYISHIAARIINKYPEASNNLVRAIMASSAEYPKEICDIIANIVDNEKGLNKCFTHNIRGQEKNNFIKMLYYTAGYGLPLIADCLESFENRVVLLADLKESQDLIKVDTMHVFRIPLPEELKNSKGKKNIIVSLAYNPRVRNTRLDYMGISMEFRLIKGKSQQEVINIYKKQKRNEKIGIDGCECDTVPGINIRSNGTLQRAKYQFTLNKGFNGEDLYLVVNSKKEWDNEDQKYAVVVTLQSEDQTLKLYNIIKNRLQQRATIRTRA